MPSLPVYSSAEPGTPSDRSGNRVNSLSMTTCFDPGELRAQAEVLACSEGDMGVGRAGDGHPLGALEAARIGVRRRQHRDEDVPAPERPTVELQIAPDVARLGDLDRADEAEELLDRRRRKRPVAPEAGLLLGGFQQGQDTTADQVHRRLTAGDQEQERHRQELVLAQRVAVLLGLHQGGHEPGARVPPAFRETAPGGRVPLRHAARTTCATLHAGLGPGAA